MLIILTCLLCALICVVGLMAVTRCVRCHQLPVQRTTDHELGPNKCLKMKVINSLSKHIFESSSSTADADASATDTATVAVAECVICLSEFSDGEEVREFPGCCHVFHIECIDTWLIRCHSFSCPSCRRALGAVNQCQNQTCRTGVSADARQRAEFLP